MAPSRVTGFHSETEVILHDLCQPLTTLRCRLDLALMQRVHSVHQTDELYDAVQHGLEDIRLIFELVERLRQSLLAEKQRQETSG
jgi:hypothetical protein